MPKNYRVLQLILLTSLISLSLGFSEDHPEPAKQLLSKKVARALKLSDCESLAQACAQASSGEVTLAPATMLSLLTSKSSLTVAFSEFTNVYNWDTGQINDLSCTEPSDRQECEKLSAADALTLFNIATYPTRSIGYNRRNDSDVSPAKCAYEITHAFADTMKALKADSN